MQLRTELDLFANVVICKSPVGTCWQDGMEWRLALFIHFILVGVTTRHKKVDFVIIRQNTEAEYSGLEHEVPRHFFLYDGYLLILCVYFC